MKKIEYHMLMCIVNAGFSGEVMSCVREVGAKGGTVIHARGTIRKEAGNAFGVVINPEKDIVLIVVKDDIKDKVMEAIYKHVGIETEGKAVVFSLPVTNQVGLKD